MKNVNNMETTSFQRGRWIMDNYTHRYRCSVCNAYQPYELIDEKEDIVDYWDCNFCPICGVKMSDIKETPE